MDKICIAAGQKSFKAGEIRRHKDYYIVYFNKRPLWLLYRNNYYEEVMQEDFPNEHYRSKHQVPIYRIMKRNRKVGSLYPRIAEKTGNDFLFCPKNKVIKKHYYIWDLNNKHTIRDYASIERMI